jgi:Zinc carboxypeptidase
MGSGMVNPLAPYPSPEARDDELAARTAALGGELVPYGQSVQGRRLLAARIGPTHAAAADCPRVLISANIHGLEYIGSRLTMGVLQESPPAEILELRQKAELWVIPCLNPDGYARTWEQQGHGSVAQLRSNANGVDLNRNFPLPTGAVRRRLPGAGSTTPGAATYVGSAPLSEPETAALSALLHEQRFAAAINIHSFLGRTIPAHVTDRDSYETYATLCRTFSQAQKSWHYPRLASRWLDTFTGELEDYQHHHLGTWAMCLETFSLPASLLQNLRAPSAFFRFNPRDPMPWVQNDVPAMGAYFLQAIQLASPLLQQ